MIKKETYIGIYWGARNESLENCVRAVGGTLNFLRTFDESFKEWYHSTNTERGEIFQPIDATNQGIRKLLLKGQNYTDIGHHVLEDLGYLLRLTSEIDYTKAHSLSVGCSAYFDQIKAAPNRVVLTLSNDNQHLINSPVLEKIYKGLVKIWTPEKGIIVQNDIKIISEGGL